MQQIGGRINMNEEFLEMLHCDWLTTCIEEKSLDLGAAKLQTKYKDVNCDYPHAVPLHLQIVKKTKTHEVTRDYRPPEGSHSRIKRQIDTTTGCPGVKWQHITRLHRTSLDNELYNLKTKTCKKELRSVGRTLAPQKFGNLRIYADFSEKQRSHLTNLANTHKKRTHKNQEARYKKNTYLKTMTGFSWISVWALARAMALTFWPVANDGRKILVKNSSSGSDNLSHRQRKQKCVWQEKLEAIVQRLQEQGSWYGRCLENEIGMKRQRFKKKQRKEGKREGKHGGKSSHAHLSPNLPNRCSPSSFLVAQPTVVTF